MYTTWKWICEKSESLMKFRSEHERRRDRGRWLPASTAGNHERYYWRWTAGLGAAGMAERGCLGWDHWRQEEDHRRCCKRLPCRGFGWSGWWSISFVHCLGCTVKYEEKWQNKESRGSANFINVQLYQCLKEPLLFFLFLNFLRNTNGN
jgi:hypothetical protein